MYAGLWAGGVFRAPRHLSCFIPIVFYGGWIRTTRFFLNFFISGSGDPISGSRDTKLGSRDTISGSRDQKTGSRDTISGSRDLGVTIWLSHDFDILSRDPKIIHHKIYMSRSRYPEMIISRIRLSISRSWDSISRSWDKKFWKKNVRCPNSATVVFASYSHIFQWCDVSRFCWAGICRAGICRAEICWAFQRPSVRPLAEILQGKI